jgi:5-amino-6-(5-phospho-D-ribitylamino)uracil phosphatase
MTCNYDILVVDLDGTLLKRDGSVSTANRKALDDARAAGLEVIIATGRALIESRPAIEAVAHQGLVVAAGGSLLCDAATGHTIDRRTICADTVRDISAHLLNDGHKVLILKDAHATGFDYLAVGDGPLDPASEWWFANLPVTVRHVADLESDSHPDDTVRAGAVGCHTRLGPLAGQMRTALGDRCCLQHWSAVTSTHSVGSATHLLEVFTTNVSKWTMIEGYCRTRHVDRARVASIGDGLNDVELLRESGLGVAMANAGPEAMSVADRFTDHHEADGVANAVRSILSGAW